MFSTAVIAILGVLLLIGTVIPGIRLYWPQHTDAVSRSDLGIALMTGALIAFSVLALQLVIQIRSQRDANDRSEQAERQALLLLLGRSKDLSGLDLSKKDLTDAYLNGKVLRGASLKESVMKNASFQDADLVGANLRGATLEKAHLDRADLRYADLAGAKLVDAILRGVNLDAAALSPRQKGKKAVPVDLTRADLSNASLRADLHDAVLVKARLVGTRLAPANLQGADLEGADLFLADLRGADLRGADLRDAVNLEKAKDLSFARFDSATRWPRTFRWPEDGKRPACGEGTCVLPRTSDAVNDFPPELDSMRKQLAKAIAAPNCLPGWKIDEQPLKIEAYAPGARARFDMATASTDKNAKSWAQSFPGRINAQEIRSITAVGAASTFAESFVHAENGRPREVVVVYFVRGQRGFRVWGSASPALFPLFQRDFVRLFRSLGIGGNLFPSLRGGKDGCRR